MEIAAALTFVREHHRAVLLTWRRDGSAQMSPIVCAVDDDATIVVSTRATAVKAKNVQRDPRVSLCVLSDGFFGSWVQVDGRAEIVPLPEAMDGLVHSYRAISGEHPDWDDYRAAMERERRVLLRVRLERAGPDVSG